MIHLHQQAVPGWGRCGVNTDPTRHPTHAQYRITPEWSEQELGTHSIKQYITHVIHLHQQAVPGWGRCGVNTDPTRHPTHAQYRITPEWSEQELGTHSIKQYITHVIHLHQQAVPGWGRCGVNTDPTQHPTHAQHTITPEWSE